jgi:hypothetical protein
MSEVNVELNGERFLFGDMEKRAFAEASGDVRVKMMMLRIDELKRKLARNHEYLVGLEAEVGALKGALTRVRRCVAHRYGVDLRLFAFWANSTIEQIASWTKGFD